MKVKNNSDSDINLVRGEVSLKLVPGVNTIPEYEWVEAAVKRSRNLEYILDVEITKTGTISKSSHIETKRVKVGIKRKAK